MNIVALQNKYIGFVSVSTRKSSIGVFRCDSFNFNFLSDSHSAIRLLLSTCASLYCSHAEKIRDIGDFEEQAKVTLPTGNHRTLPK